MRYDFQYLHKYRNNIIIRSNEIVTFSKSYYTHYTFDIEYRCAKLTVFFARGKFAPPTNTLRDFCRLFILIYFKPIWLKV